MLRLKDKIRTNAPIEVKKIVIFFILFSASYWLLNYIFNEILYLTYKDVFNQIHSDNNEQVIFHRVLEYNKWSHVYKPYILLAISGLIFIGIILVKRNYFKEAIIAFFTFIFTVFMINLSIKLYHDKQERDKNIYTKLIIGKWNYKNPIVGNVTIIFNKDKSGIRFADSIKAIQKFHYIISKNSFLTIYFESNKDEFYNIDSLTIKALNMRAGPFTRVKDNIYGSNFKRIP